MNELNSFIPFKNFADGLDKFAEGSLAAGEIMDKIMIDRAKEEDPDEKWARVRQEEADADKAADYRAGLLL